MTAKKTVTTLRSESRKERNSDHYCNSSTGLTHPSLSRRALKCWYNRKKWHKETLELPKSDWRSETFITSSRKSVQNWIASSSTDQNTPASKESTVQMFWVTMINTSSCNDLKKTHVPSRSYIIKGRNELRWGLYLMLLYRGWGSLYWCHFILHQVGYQQEGFEPPAGKKPR